MPRYVVCVRKKVVMEKLYVVEAKDAADAHIVYWRANGPRRNVGTKTLYDLDDGFISDVTEVKH